MTLRFNLKVLFHNILAYITLPKIDRQWGVIAETVNLYFAIFD